MENIIDRELGWDDEIEHDGEGFTLLPEGDYQFRVLSFERARHPGSAKLPPCNKAELKIQLESSQGKSVITHNRFPASGRQHQQRAGHAAGPLVFY